MPTFDLSLVKKPKIKRKDSFNKTKGKYTVVQRNIKGVCCILYKLFSLAPLFKILEFYRIGYVLKFYIYLVNILRAIARNIFGVSYYLTNQLLYIQSN